MSEEVEILPMGITRVDANSGCVAALTLDGRWFRPGPVLAADLTVPHSPYRYRHRLLCQLGSAPGADSRPEDRHLLGYAHLPSGMTAMPESEWLDWCIDHCDSSAVSSFSGQRSIGLIEAVPLRVYLQRSTGQRMFVRMVFRDPAGVSYDWIVPEIEFSRLSFALSRANADSMDVSALLLPRLRDVRSFLCLGLTKPNNRFPGVFRGCQPLVVGVHTFPDYGRMFGYEFSNYDER